MGHGIVDVFAYQEALLIEAVFGLALLVMIWVGFRRWLGYKQEMSRLNALQTAELTAEYRALLERVEARLNSVEQLVNQSSTSTPVQIDASQNGGIVEPDEA